MTTSHADGKDPERGPVSRATGSNSPNVGTVCRQIDIKTRKGAEVVIKRTGHATTITGTAEPKGSSSQTASLLRPNYIHSIPPQVRSTAQERTDNRREKKKIARSKNAILRTRRGRKHEGRTRPRRPTEPISSRAHAKILNKSEREETDARVSKSPPSSPKAQKYSFPITQEEGGQRTSVYDKKVPPKESSNIQSEEKCPAMRKGRRYGTNSPRARKCTCSMPRLCQKFEICFPLLKEQRRRGGKAKAIRVSRPVGVASSSRLIIVFLMFRCTQVVIRRQKQSSMLVYPLRLHLHDDAVLVIALLGDLARSRGRHIHGSALAADSRLDNSQALLRSLIASVSRLDVPHIRLKDVAATPDAHFGEVSEGILSFDKT